MGQKAQHGRAYRIFSLFLRTTREQANLTQRELGKRLDRPQSWVHNCETGNRRVDITEFISWVTACKKRPTAAFRQLLKMLEDKRAA